MAKKKKKIVFWCKNVISIDITKKKSKDKKRTLEQFFLETYL